MTIDDNDNVTTKPGIDLTIDCGPLIDAAGITNAVIRWYKNDVPLSNGSEINVVISENERELIINETLVAVGGQLGTEGVYTCEVCNGSLCFRNSITTEICGKLMLRQLNVKLYLYIFKMYQI